MPRAQSSKQSQRHDPLHVQLKHDEELEKYGRTALTGKRKKARIQKKDNEEEDGDDVCLIEETLGRNI